MDNNIIEFPGDTKLDIPPEKVLEDNVIEFPGATYADFPPEKVLKAALENVDELESVIIICRRKDKTRYFSSSVSSSREILWALEATKFQLMNMCIEPEE
jgi:hypothetical protein